MCTQVHTHTLTFFNLVVLGMEPSTSCVLGKHLPAEPQPQHYFLSVVLNFIFSGCVQDGTEVSESAQLIGLVFKTIFQTGGLAQQGTAHCQAW